MLSVTRFSLFKCSFGIGYGIGRKYLPIWVSVSVSDRNQDSGFGRKLSHSVGGGDDYCIFSLSKMMRCQTKKKGQRD